MRSPVHICKSHCSSARQWGRLNLIWNKLSNPSISMQKMLLIVPNQRYMYLIDQMKLLSSRERQDPSTQHFACLSEQERQNFAKSFKIPRDI